MFLKSDQSNIHSIIIMLMDAAIFFLTICR